MGSIPKLPLLLLTTVVLLLAAFTELSESNPVPELLSLQSRSSSGVIRLDDRSLAKFLTAVKTPRPYWVLVFFDAAKLHDKSELHLKELRKEFAVVASSFIENNQDPSSPSHAKLFFCDIEFQESQHSFAQFGVNSLPHIRLIGPTHGLKDSPQMDQGDFSRLAESMSEFIQSKTKLVVGPIHRPPMLSKNQIMFVTIAWLICMPFIAKKVYSGKTLLHDPRIWLAGSVFVYFFSVSGAMHNIIRNMPMFLVDREDPSKLIFFYQGSGMQLGTEGFTVGFLYTIVGLLLAFLTRVLVTVRSVKVQRIVMIIALFVSFFAVKKVIQLDNWKTGYGVNVIFICWMSCSTELWTRLSFVMASCVCKELSMVKLQFRGLNVYIGHWVLPIPCSSYRQTTHHHTASASTITQLEEQLSSSRIRIEELQSELETAKTEDTASRDVILKLHDELEAGRNESTCFKFQVLALSSAIDSEFENKREETPGLKQQVFKLEAEMQEKDTRIQRMGDAFEYEEFVNKDLNELVTKLLEHNT
ncbi:hypothetical protein ACFX14_005296 [Malus domestica]